MKNKVLLLLSILFVTSGLLGLYLVNRPASVETQSGAPSFDPLLLSESEIFKNVDSSNMKRVSSLLRESKKRKPAIKEWIFTHFNNEELVVQEAMLISLGNYRDKDAVEFLVEIVNQRSNEIHSFYALKGLSTHEDLIRVLSLQKVDLTNRSDKFLIHYHFALFKTKSYFADKKENLYWLVEKGGEIKGSNELRLIVMGLSEYVPNFEKFHELLKVLLLKSRDEVILNRAIIHLSVYDSGWLKVQTENIIKSNNEVLIKEFLARSGAFCPLDIWEAFKIYATKYNLREGVRMAARVNMMKAQEIGKELKMDPMVLADILKFKNSTLCY